jgi:four helix bundle suffix protein
MEKRPLIPSHGGFRNLHAFKLSEVVYDATLVFCERFVDKKSRTTDQMIQAARSGRQNIAEGSVDSGTSKKSELYLTNIARGSLVELQLDYEDFLRQNGLPIWEKDDPRCMKIRAKAFELDQNPKSNQSDKSNQNHLPKRYRKDIAYPLYAKFFETASAEIAANTAICLINQATYLLNRLLARLEKDFVEKGGFTERLYEVRKANKRSQ